MADPLEYEIETARAERVKRSLEAASEAEKRLAEKAAAEVERARIDCGRNSFIDRMRRAGIFDGEVDIQRGTREEVVETRGLVRSRREVRDVPVVERCRYWLLDEGRNSGVGEWGTLLLETGEMMFANLHRRRPERVRVDGRNPYCQDGATLLRLCARYLVDHDLA